MKRLGILIITLIGLHGLNAVTVNLEAKETASFQFLKLGAGARAAAMGDAATSLSDDVTAAYWNPAGLTAVKSPEVSMMQNNWLLGTRYQYAGGAAPVGKYVLAATFQRMDYGSMERYSAGDNREGSFDASSLAGGLALAAKVNEHVSWGVGLKFLNDSIDSTSATGFAGDAGVLLTWDTLRLGASLQNMGPNVKYVKEKERLPRMMRLGISRAFFHEKLRGAMDLSKAVDNNMSVHTGLDFKVNPLLNLRAGYRTTPGKSADLNGLANLTGGIGLNFTHLSIDYAFLPYGDLGQGHKFSIMYKFHGIN